MRQPKYEACSTRLGQIVLVSWMIGFLILFLGAAMACGVIPSTLRLFDLDTPTTHPQYPPMSGLVYVSARQGDCTLLRPKSIFGYGILLPGDAEYTVCNGLQVEILQAAWIDSPASGCYLYHVHVPGSLGFEGWIPQDELTPDLNVPPDVRCFSQ
jgi:hypothetical protein